MTALLSQGEAVFDSSGLYRYWLTRTLGEHRREFDPATDQWIGPPPRVCVFCMLNPSTANADDDDPTIRRCKGFAHAWGYHRLVIVNMYAIRATDPGDMIGVWKMGEDIVGPDNDHYITKAVQMARQFPGAVPVGNPLTLPSGGLAPVLEFRPLVVCAWGKPNFPKRARGAALDRRLQLHADRVLHVRKLIGEAAHVLKLNESDGSPVHPLYQPAELRPIPWPLENAA